MPRRLRRELPRPAIADVLRELTGVEHIPTGYGWVRISCPFHEDRTPSAAVNHEIDGFICHSCQRSGDALKLLRNELRVTFHEATERASALTTGLAKGNTKRNRRPSDLLVRSGGPRDSQNESLTPSELLKRGNE